MPIDYELLGPATRREMLVNELRGLEQQHYQHVLVKIANAGNDEAQRNTQTVIDKTERAIAVLRDELARHDAAQAAAEAGDDELAKPTGDTPTPPETAVAAPQLDVGAPTGQSAG